MAFELKNVVPWGRNLAEYQLMFNLKEEDLQRRIISFGDGPASFNAQMTTLGHQVISIDPVYHFSTDALRERIAETKDEVIAQVSNNREIFVWKHIKDVAHLEEIRMQAMEHFLEDYELGKQEGRYIPHAMPNPTTYTADSFELGLSSHFLILYSKLGLPFHLDSIQEMLRICREVRIFPLLDLDAQESSVLPGILSFFQAKYEVSIESVDYEFQKNGNQMLRISRK